MPRRRSLLVSAAAALALTVGASACSDQDVALRVDDDTLSDAELVDEIKGYKDLYEQDAEGQGQEPPDMSGELEGSFNRDLSCDVILKIIDSLVIGQMFDDAGLKLTGADRAAALEQFGPGAEDALDQVSPTIRKRVVDDSAMAAKLTDELGQEAETIYQEKLEKVKVELGTRWGTWNPDSVSQENPCPIEPPEGPAKSKDADSAPESPQSPEAPEVIPGG